MAKKETLKLNDNDFGKVKLFTIASSESDIRMCMLINNVFKINMSLSDDLMVRFASETVGFKKYQYIDESEEEKYILLINHHQSGKFLFSEYKQIDFILIITTEMSGHSFDNQIKVLKENPGIAAIFKIDPATNKSFKKITI